MDCSNLTELEKTEFSKMMFSHLNSSEDVKNWVRLFLDLEIPLEITDPDSNSSPLDAIWQIYNTFKTNSGDKNPGYILMSCREGMKTVSVAILETLLLTHFSLDIGHAAATEEQSAVALGYIDSFLMKIEPLMLVAGWTNLTQNKRLFKFKTPEQKRPFIKIVICTPKGMNSLHSNVLFLDELDLADPKALSEGKYITSHSKGIYGVKVYLSTRKYAYGNMSIAIDRAPDMNYKIINWNIIDICERCPPERHLPNGPKQNVYIGKNLPLKNLTIEEFNILPDIEKPKWDLIENVHQGCAKCPLLPVCKTRLANKSPEATGGFHKPIVSVIQSFLENDPDSAEAQLMCFGPTTQILMSDGTSKSIENVKIGDRVITHVGSSKRVIEVFKRKYEGDVYLVDNVNWKHFDSTIATPEHPYFINGKEFKSISNILPFKFDRFGGLKSKGDYVSLPIEYEPYDSTEIRFKDLVNKETKSLGGKIRLKHSTGRYIPEKFNLNYDFGWMIGYYAAEGYVSERTYSKEKRCTSITFCSDVREIDYHERVRKFASSIGLSTSELASKKGNGYTIDYYNTTIAELFLAMCGRYSDKKKFHPKLMDANLNFLKGILEGFDAGDGTKRKKPYKELTTTSYDLASQLFTIAARLGLCPRITKKPSVKDRKQAYLVHYIDMDHIYKQKRTKFKFENKYNQYRIDNLSTKSYNGYVYNIEVEKDHSYIANGVAVHNCWKPGSTGLVYPRFSKTENIITLKQAWETLFGPTNKAVNELMLLHAMKNLGILFYAGIDWGYVHDTTFLIVAMIPNGEVWLMETYASPGLEFADQLEVGKAYRDKYTIHKWFADTAMPSNLKSFNKNGMKCPNFKKDVLGGVEAVRSKISSASGKRFFKIIQNESNKKAITAISKHRFILDGQGNPTMNPDDERGVADICDSLRYIGQNCFPVRGTQKPEAVWMDNHGKPVNPHDPEQMAAAERASIHQNQMKEEIAKRVGGEPNVISSGKKGGFYFTF